MNGLKWKQYTGYSIEGKPFRNDASAFNRDETLLQRISNMPKRDRQIDIYTAFGLYWHEIVASVIEEGDVDHAGDVTNTDWVTWISRQGYQIVLKGDEYEL